MRTGRQQGLLHSAAACHFTMALHPYVPVLLMSSHVPMKKPLITSKRMAACGCTS